MEPKVGSIIEAHLSCNERRRAERAACSPLHCSRRRGILRIGKFQPERFGMIRGGIADKLGNAYEAQWYALHLLRVFIGRSAQALTLEPLNAPGFEFSYEAHPHIEWHQCKTRTRGSWTLSALDREGVLGFFKDRLSRCASNKCVFVSDTNAQSLSRLSKFAQQAQDFSDFQSMIGQSQEARRDFGELRSIWSASDDDAFMWLKRCRVTMMSSDAISHRLEELIEAYFSTSTETVRDRMATMAIEHLTRRITTDALRTLLLSSGLTPRDFSIDPTLRARVEQATEEYLDTISAAAPKVRISRPEVEERIVDWHGNAVKRILFVSGGAGTGKSLILSNVISRFREDGVPVLAFRIDRYLDTPSLISLGQELLGVGISPIVPLAHVDQQSTPVLVIDQIDAVSSASGRRRKAKDLLLNLIREHEAASNVKIIVACRSYDLTNDEEFKGKANEEVSDTFPIPNMDWDDDIAPALRSLGFETKGFSDNDRRLLTVPIHLSTYLKLDLAADGMASFTSGADLIDQLVEKTDRALADDGEAWSAWEALGEIADRMSRDQVLSAPRAVLDRFRNARRRLCSAGLIVDHGNAIQFSHETYFDFVFARRFHASGVRVRDWLISSEQNLFRRTQVRQILQYLRTHGTSGDYIRALDDVLVSEGIRFHVRDAAARWLSTVERPMVGEFEVILRSGEISTPSALMQRALGSNWFPMLSERGIIDHWLGSNDEDVAMLAAGRISQAFEDHPEAAHKSLKRLSFPTAPDLRDRLLRIVRSARPGDDPSPLVEIYSDLIGTMSLAELEDEVYHLGSFYHWRNVHAPLAISLVARAVERWLSLDDAADPFIGDGMNQRAAPHQAQELAKIAPAAFVKEFAPLYAEVLKRIAEEKTGHDGRHADRMFTKSFPTRERWGGLISDSLPAAANVDESCLLSVHDNFNADRSAIDRFFILCAIAADPKSGSSQFARLIDHPDLFDADHDGDEWLPAAEAARAVRPHLDDETWCRFEARLRAHRPEHKRAKQALDWHRKDPEGLSVSWRAYAVHQLTETGLHAWRILRVIGKEAKLSPQLRGYEAELDRKFCGRELVRERTGARAVVSPISADRAEKMSDQAWLSAMKRYGDDEREGRWDRGDADSVPGGARELAGTLEFVTKNAPERMVGLLHRMPLDVNPKYPFAVLDGLRGSQNTDLILQAMRVVRRFLNNHTAFSFLLLAESTAEAGCEQFVFDFVKDFAVNGDDPSRSGLDSADELRGTLKVDDLFDRFGRSTVSGIGADRHMAWRALARFAEKVPVTREPVLELLEIRAEKEDNRDVWAAMIEASVSCIGHDRERVLNIWERIAERDIRIIAVFSVPRVYSWALWQDWDRFSWIADQMIQSDLPVLTAIATEWFAVRYFDCNESEVRLIELCESSSLARRAAASVAHDFISETRFESRALDWLMAHADDPSPDVVKQVFSPDWAELLDAGGPRVTLAERLLESENFGDHAQRLIYALDDRTSAFPELALKAAQRVLDHVGAEHADTRFSDRELALHNLGKLITGAAEAYAEQGRASTPALDLIDQYLRLNHYGVEAEVKKLDDRS